MSTHQIDTLSDASFNCFIHTNSYAIVDFGAPWCGYCRSLSPIMEILAKDYHGKIAFGKVNIDNHFQLSEQFEIMTVPTLLFFRNGALVDTVINPVSKAFIENKITSLLR